MGPTWGPSGADRTQVGPMLGHEPCYLGCYYQSDHDDVMRSQWSRSTMVQLMACLIDGNIGSGNAGTKPLPEPILVYWQQHPEYISAELHLILIIKMDLKLYFQKKSLLPGRYELISMVIVWQLSGYRCIVQYDTRKIKSWIGRPFQVQL